MVGTARVPKIVAAVWCEVHSPAISIGTVSASTPITVRVLVVPVRGSRTTTATGSNVVSSM